MTTIVTTGDVPMVMSSVTYWAPVRKKSSHADGNDSLDVEFLSCRGIHILKRYQLIAKINAMTGTIQANNTPCVEETMMKTGMSASFTIE